MLLLRKSLLRLQECIRCVVSVKAIDCAGNGNQGCDGGDTCSLIMWLADNKIKIEPEKGYPLVLETQSCKLKKT